MERKKRIGNERVQKILLDDDRTRFKKWIETLVNSVDSSRMIVLTNGSTRWRANFPPSYSLTRITTIHVPAPRSIIIQTSIRSNFRQISRAIEFKRLCHYSKLVVVRIAYCRGILSKWPP